MTRWPALQSVNGTFVNGDKIVQRTELLEGDLVGIGNIRSIDLFAGGFVNIFFF